MVRVKSVVEGSIAQELGIAAGTELVSVNGRELADFLDWEFLSADDELVIEAREPNGELVVYEIDRPEGEPGELVSLFAVGGPASGVTTSGLRWELVYTQSLGNQTLHRLRGQT